MGSSARGSPSLFGVMDVTHRAELRPTRNAPILTLIDWFRPSRFHEDSHTTKIRATRERTIGPHQGRDPPPGTPNRSPVQAEMRAVSAGCRVDDGSGSFGSGLPRRHCFNLR